MKVATPVGVKYGMNINGMCSRTLCYGGFETKRVILATPAPQEAP